MNVFFGFEAKPAAIRVAALHDKFPRARGKKQAAFLLNQGNALGAGFHGNRVRGETV